jgi:hypothetical protein
MEMLFMMNVKYVIVIQIITVFRIVKVTGEVVLNLMSVVYVMEIRVHALAAWI